MEEEGIMELIEQINKLNLDLCQQIIGLEQEVESLQNYREELKNGGDGACRHRQQKISATLQLLSSTNSPTGVCLSNHQKELDGQQLNSRKNGKPPKPNWMSETTYSKSVGIYKSGFRLKNCPGCNQVFQTPMAISQSSFEYLVHVIEECVKYKELNLITECEECNLKFPTQKSYHLHESMNHSTKPQWMTAHLFSKRNRAGPWISVPCPGCSRELKRVRKGIYRLSDYVHMVEDCEGYKKLDRIKTCRKCNCKFINSNSFRQHKCWFSFESKFTFKNCPW